MYIPLIVLSMSVHDVNVNYVLPVKLRQRLMSLIKEFSCRFPDVPGRTSVAERKIELLDKIA